MNNNMFNDKDNFFRDVARRYAEADGNRLKQELAEMNRYPVYSDPLLDARLRRRVDEYKQIQSRRRQSRMKTWPLIAAAAALFVIISGILPVIFSLNNYNEPPMTSEGEYEIIPLTFALPPNLSVESVEQDKGQSVYYLSDQFGDDVVMTLETGSPVIDRQGLVLIHIKEHPVYVYESGDYNLMILRYNGITYTVSCRHDINTLADICFRIV